MNVDITLCCKGNSPTYLFGGCLSQDLPQWRSHVAEKDGLVAVAYHQNSKINLVSSLFTVSEKKGATKKDRQHILDHYDNTKRWGDQFDQLFSYFFFDHAHADWRVTLLIGWFGWCHTNAYVLYKDTVKHPLDHYNFLMEAGREWLAGEVPY